MKKEILTIFMIVNILSLHAFEHEIVQYNPHDQDMQQQLVDMILNDKKMAGAAGLVGNKQILITYFSKHKNSQTNPFFVAKIKDSQPPVYIGLAKGEIKQCEAELHHLAVDQKYRKKGVAIKLIKAFENQAYELLNTSDSCQKTQLLIYFYSANDAARKFYQKLNYQTYDQTNLKFYEQSIISKAIKTITKGQQFVSGMQNESQPIIDNQVAKKVL